MDEHQQFRREHLAAGAIYGTIVYLTILVLLEEDRTPPADAIAILVGAAVVFWLAHVYAHLVPRIAVAGRLRTGRLLETAGEQVGILVAVAIPVTPLLLASLGLLDPRAGFRIAIAAGILSLGGFGSREARAARLGWWRPSGSPWCSWSPALARSGSTSRCTDRAGSCHD